MEGSNEKRPRQPVLAVVGPTATGKTALGVRLALALGGEIISADSMQVYKGLDVGTAKVTPEEARGVPHHCVDILPPEAPFSVADFTALAGQRIGEIAARGRLPILVGGTGLYVQSLLYGVRFAREKAPEGLRARLAAELEARGPAAMYAQLQAVDPEAAAAIHPNNHVRVLRALEHYQATGCRLSSQKADSLPAERPYRALVLGLDFADRADLYRRIDVRVDRMMEQGAGGGGPGWSISTGRAIPRRPRPSDTRNCSRILRGRPLWRTASKSSSRPPAATPSGS